MRSTTVGIPRRRVFPLPLGISTPGWVVAGICQGGFRIRGVPCFLSGRRTNLLPASRPCLPNLCSTPHGEAPALHSFGSVPVQSSGFTCFVCSVPLITRLAKPPCLIWNILMFSPSLCISGVG